MSLLNSLFSGVSGMKNHQSMMDVVGNNISNVNTVGFKGSRVTFSDTFNQFIRYGSDPVGTNGGTNTFQVGLGMKLASVDRNWNQGTFERTGITTDLALQGDGLFILENNGERFYSRAGAFSFDANGNLVSTSTGAVVQGKMATEEGAIPAGNNLESITLDLNQTVPAVKTSKVEWVGNLNSQATITRSQNAIQTGNISSNLAVGASTDDFVSTIYDPDGTEYVLTVTYTKTAANEYDMVYKIDETAENGGGAIVAATTVPLVFDPATEQLDAATGINGGAPAAFQIDDATTGIDFNLDLTALTESTTSTTIATSVDTGRDATKIDGTVTVYDSLGEAHSITVSFTKTADNTWNWVANTSAEDGTLVDNRGQITFASDGSIATISPSDTPAIQFTPASGAEAQTIALDFGEISGFDGVTQTSSDSVVSVQFQDGSAAASLTNVNIDQYGNIVGVFSNGTTRSLAQIMVATFPNNNGLISIGDNMYQVSANSGAVLVADPGEASGTTIQSGALEQSNVDLSEEFTKMIIAQRGFQANARVITTSDSLLQEITNLVR